MESRAERTLKKVTHHEVDAPSFLCKLSTLLLQRNIRSFWQMDRARSRKLFMVPRSPPLRDYYDSSMVLVVSLDVTLSIFRLQ